MAQFILANPNLFQKDIIQLFVEENQDTLTQSQKDQFGKLLA